MLSKLDFNAYALKIVFNLLGGLGSSLLNFGRLRNLVVVTDMKYGSEADQRLDVFRPKSAKSSGLPILIFFHGGGWISADKKIYKGIAATFSRNGFVTFNVNYRLAPKHRFSAQLQDAVRAIEWIYRHAAEYGGDRSVMILAGDSAGAQIASWYASALHNDRLFHQIDVRCLVNRASVKGLLLFYGVYDFDTLRNTGFPFIRTYAQSFLGDDAIGYAKNSKIASPIKQISRAIPPVWLCAGERDSLFAQTNAYAQALKSRGVQCQALLFSKAERANHGFLFFHWLEPSKVAVASALEFLRDRAGVDC
jgi:acetyl esterase/lipase